MKDLNAHQINAVGEFTVRFAYLEFLAVQKGYYSQASDGAQTRIDGLNWRELVEAIAKELSDDGAKEMVEGFLKSAEDFATNEPPGNLLLDGRRLRFGLTARDRDKPERWKNGALSTQDKLAFTFDLLKNVRNNLFHGSKTIDRPELTEKRMKECIPIIEDAINLVQLAKNRKDLYWQ